MEEVTGDGGTIMMMDTIEMLNGGDNSAGNVQTPISDTSSFMMSGSFKEGGRGSGTGGHRRATVRPSLDADELMNLLHESDPVKLEFNRLENEIRDKDRELGEAQAEIKALKLSERLKEKAVEELTEELSKVEEKLKLTESLLESKNLEIKKINDEKKASMAAQFAAEATLRKIHAAQKDHDMPQIEAILALEAEFKLARPEIAKVQDDNKIEEFEDTKPPRELKQKRLQVKWNDEDAKTLAEQWVHASKDGVMVNGKADSAHWKTVLTTFNSRVTVKRTVSQLTGKWNKIAHDVKAFNEIYKGYSKTRLSGAKEEDVLKASRNKFKSQQGRFFIYEQCWDVLKHYPKFFLEEGVISNKRSFQPDLEPVNLKVNLKDDDVPNTNTYTERLAANMQPVILDDPIQCPPGFAISKKSQKSSGSSDAATSSRSIKEEAFEAVKIIAESQTSAIGKLAELGEKKLYWKALTFLAKGIPEGINKREKKFLNTARKNIVKTLSSDSVTMFGLGSCPGSQHQEDEKTDEDESEYSE